MVILNWLSNIQDPVWGAIIVASAILSSAIATIWIQGSKERQRLKDRVLSLETKFASHESAIGHEIRDIKSSITRIEGYLMNGKH